MSMLSGIKSSISKVTRPIIRPIENAAARGINSLAHTGTASRIAEWGAKESTKTDLLGKSLNNFSAKIVPSMAALLPIWISAFYVINNLKSDKIPKERKTPLLINDIIVCTISTIAGMTVAKLFDAMQIGMVENMKKVVTSADKQALLKGGIKQMMAIAAFTLVFRFLGPVIATPLADKVNSFLIKHKLIKDPRSDKAKEQTPAATKTDAKDATGQNLNVSLASNIPASPAFEKFLQQYTESHLPTKHFVA
ncbi:MAG: hypothetical protein AB1782_18465 [Cyanobacteriota bacterium]